MRISYFKDGVIRNTTQSNSDIKISEVREGNHTTIKVLAGEEITLAKAYVDYPCFINYKDLYFLNGYQSWTDTKEYKLATPLRAVNKCPHIITALFSLNCYGDSNFYRYSIRKSHGHDVFYSKGEHECFIYNLNYKTAYLIVELIKDRSYIRLISDIERLKVKKGEEVTIFDYCYYDNFEKAYMNSGKLSQLETLRSY